MSEFDSVRREADLSFAHELRAVALWIIERHATEDCREPQEALRRVQDHLCGVVVQPSHDLEWLLRNDPLVHAIYHRMRADLLRECTCRLSPCPHHGRKACVVTQVRRRTHGVRNEFATDPETIGVYRNVAEAKAVVEGRDGDGLFWDKSDSHGEVHYYGGRDAPRYSIQVFDLQ